MGMAFCGFRYPEGAGMGLCPPPSHYGGPPLPLYHHSSTRLGPTAALIPQTGGTEGAVFGAGGEAGCPTVSSPAWAAGSRRHLAARARGADVAVTGMPCPAPFQPSPVAPGHAPGVTAPWESRAADGKTERAQSQGTGWTRASLLPWDIAASLRDPDVQHPPVTSC